MSKRVLVTCILASVFLVACGGDTEDGDGGQPPAPVDPIEALLMNAGTVECDLFSADDLAVEGCNRVVNLWLITMRKRPRAVILGLPSIEAGTYEADGGGQGLAITVTDATDMEDIKNYGIGKLKVVLEVDDGVVRGTYEGEVMKDYVEPFPVRGVFKFDQSVVSE